MFCTDALVHVALLVTLQAARQAAEARDKLGRRRPHVTCALPPEMKPSSINILGSLEAIAAGHMNISGKLSIPRTCKNLAASADTAEV